MVFSPLIPYLSVFLVSVLWSELAYSQSKAGGVDVTVERDRIRLEREAAQVQYEQEALLCQGKFAVNDCLKSAQKKRRDVTDHLRRQEISLNDHERKLKAAQQLDKIERRQATVKSRHEKPEVRAHERKNAPALSEQDFAAQKYVDKQTKAAYHRQKKLEDGRQAQKKSPAPGLPVPTDH
jgi:hypothetical protein